MVSGGEDGSVYFFDVESGALVNKLQGHSSPTLCICWTYDESSLASCDIEVSYGAGRLGVTRVRYLVISRCLLFVELKGTIIVWKREQRYNSSTPPNQRDKATPSHLQTVASSSVVVVF